MSIENWSTFYKLTRFIKIFFINNFKIIIFSYVSLKINFKSKNSSKFDNCVRINFYFNGWSIKTIFNNIFWKNFFLVEFGYNFFRYYFILLIFCYFYGSALRDWNRKFYYRITFFCIFFNDNSNFLANRKLVWFTKFFIFINDYLNLSIVNFISF